MLWIARDPDHHRSRVVPLDTELEDDAALEQKPHHTWVAIPELLLAQLDLTFTAHHPHHQGISGDVDIALEQGCLRIDLEQRLLVTDVAVAQDFPGQHAFRVEPGAELLLVQATDIQGSAQRGEHFERECGLVRLEAAELVRPGNEPRVFAKVPGLGFRLLKVVQCGLKQRHAFDTEPARADTKRVDRRCVEPDKDLVDRKPVPGTFQRLLEQGLRKGVQLRDFAQVTVQLVQCLAAGLVQRFERVFLCR